ncbi:putative acetyltransferase, GNAT family [Bradyrhizobium oligotrophicum S58]|uniref:Putative acetyltransferase, GNAT family n=1 Tax=Bradyrhizobium oligotrophicum S58 TaxID=1245469 RepID=M4Z8V0_9BRAD|nr:putative acetyltransferase, GNAT family [Bradyrhizobium oligotrophicum S58]
MAVTQVDTFRPRPGFGYVRTLSQHEELPLLRDHLLRLDAESRHDRFNGFLDDSFIERYAARCAADGTIVVAYMENGMVRGAAELHPPEQSEDGLPEIAFSVEACVRRRGVGSLLFQRVISEARWKGYRQLRVTTGSQNHAMRALAAKFGAHLAFRHGESTGTIDLTQQPQDELTKLVIETPIAAARALFNLNRACWKLVTRMYGDQRAA